MPKASKNPRARLHSKAAATVKTSQTEDAATATAPDEDVAMTEARPSTSGKKARQTGVESKIPALKSQYLQTSAHPYSRSHTRRLKRKAREDLSGGSLAAVQEALMGTLETDDMDGALGDALDDTLEEDADADVVGGKKKRRRGKGKGKSAVEVTNGGFTMIGQGKGRTLKPKQRQHEILNARARVSAVIANPVFKSNPFAAIREHAGNTLVKHKAET